jgi:outer membrane protease
MKKIAVFFIFVSIGLSFSRVSLYADNEQAARPKEAPPAYTLSLHSQFGMFWGWGEEQVYQSDDSDRLLSQLLWDVKPLSYTETGIEFFRKDPARKLSLFSAQSVKFGIPMKSGLMEDRDWLSPAGELSNYSRHNNLTGGAMILDLAAGLDVPAWDFLAIRLFLGFSYTRFSWTAHDGYYRYGKYVANIYEPLTDSDSTVATSGAVVSYSQDWFALPFGLRVSIFPGRLFSGALYYSIGPVIKFIGQDDHHMRTATRYYGQFIDEANGGYAHHPWGEFRFSPPG